jgi:acylphosphatase
MIVSVDFEVCGTVQGVWFRKYTKQQATVFGLVGYCRNTRQGTVQGRIQGVDSSIQLMKQWLTTTGSPLSRIETCVFSKEEEISSPEYDSFEILHSSYDGNHHA